MKGILIKISNNDNALRTDSMEGEFEFFPKIGTSFRIFGESLTADGDIRIVTTSVVKNVEQIENIYRFQTLNSTYKLEVFLN